MRKSDTPFYQFINYPYESDLHYRHVRNKVTFDIMEQDLSRTEMLEQFELFLKACGYFFHPNESIEIVENDE